MPAYTRDDLRAGQKVRHKPTNTIGTLEADPDEPSHLKPCLVHGIWVRTPVLPTKTRQPPFWRPANALKAGEYRSTVWEIEDVEPV